MTLKCPLIIGNKGNMGRRYTAILNHLRVNSKGCDKGDAVPTEFDSIILATPSVRHIEDILFCLGFRVPILCEKPFGNNLDRVLSLCDKVDKAKVPLEMVNQYRYLDDPFSEGATTYDYFNTGKDTLPWDCISLVALARGQCKLQNKSPIWLSMLNGKVLDIGRMDYAYIEMINDWVQKPEHKPETDYIRMAHQKVAAYIEVHT